MIPVLQNVWINIDMAMNWMGDAILGNMVLISWESIREVTTNPPLRIYVGTDKDLPLPPKVVP